MSSNSDFVDKLIGLGVCASDIQLLDEEMDSDLKARILDVDSHRAYREVLSEWNLQRKTEGRPYLHD